MKGLSDTNPCPKCGKPPSLMAGINVSGGETSRTYLVCWQDGLMLDAWKKGEWIRMKGGGSRAKTPKKPEEDESMGPIFRAWDQANLA